MGLIFIQVILAEGSLRGWSQDQGELELDNVEWREIFRKPSVANGAAPKKIMFQFIGNNDAISDNDREWLMAEGRAVGFGVMRFEDSATPMTPEDAFHLMLLPFT